MELFMIFMGAAIVNNFVLNRFLGICPFLGVSKKLDTSIGMSVAVAFVLVISSVSTHLIYEYLLKWFEITFMYNITFVLVIATFVQLIEMLLKKYAIGLYRTLGVFLPLITTNCAVLALVVLNMRNEYGILQGLVNALGVAFGFGLAMVLFSGIRERLESADIPAPFKGFPIAMAAAGLMSMAFFGFSSFM